MNNDKKVQIPINLLYDLFKVHLLDQEDAQTRERIKTNLEKKLDALVMHEIYTKSKDRTLSPEEREVARIQYLDMRGIKGDFRH